jgi:flagellar biosynthesis/type III secretory pathway chaperone
MMTTSLLDLLQQQLEQLVHMNELLILEREAITSRSPENVVAATKQKTAQLDLLQLTDQQINTISTQAELDSEAVKALRHEMDNILVEVRSNNVVNGKIIQNNQSTVAMLKSILFDSKKDQSSMTYNQRGQKTAASKYKPIKA